MDISLEVIIIALIIGISVGIIASIVGLGGGILIIPLAIFLLGFDPKEAIFISLFYMTFLTISASIRYIKMKQVNYRLAALYNIFDVPGVIIGGLLTLVIAGNILAGICGSVILVLAILLFRKEAIVETPLHDEDLKHDKEHSMNGKEPEVEHKYGVSNPYIASISSFTGGLVTGLVGVGGGTTDTTSMILLGLDPKKAAATSEFAMALTAITGLIVHIFIGTYTGSLVWPIMIAIGGFIGSQIGTTLSPRVDSKKIRKALACIAFYTGILMILLMFGIGWTV